MDLELKIEIHVYYFEIYLNLICLYNGIALIIYNVIFILETFLAVAGHRKGVEILKDFAVAFVYGVGGHTHKSIIFNKIYCLKAA